MILRFMLGYDIPRFEGKYHKYVSPSLSSKLFMCEAQFMSLYVIPLFASCISIVYICFSKISSVCRSFIQYFIILSYLKINSGFRPSSQYSAERVVDRFTPNVCLQNLVCIFSISGAEWYPHTSAAYERTDPTKESNNLIFSGIFKCIFDSTFNRL